MKDKNFVAGVSTYALLKNRILPCWIFQPKNSFKLPESQALALDQEWSRLESLREAKRRLAISCAWAFFFVCLFAGHIGCYGFAMGDVIRPKLLLVQGITWIGLVLFVILAMMFLIVTLHLTNLTPLTLALQNLHEEIIRAIEQEGFKDELASRSLDGQSSVDKPPQGLFILCALTKQEFVAGHHRYRIKKAKTTLSSQNAHPESIETNAALTQLFRESFRAVEPFLALTKGDWKLSFDEAAAELATEQIARNRRVTA